MDTKLSWRRRTEGTGGWRRGPDGGKRVFLGLLAMFRCLACYLVRRFSNTGGMIDERSAGEKISQSRGRPKQGPSFPTRRLSSGEHSLPAYVDISKALRAKDGGVNSKTDRGGPCFSARCFVRQPVVQKKQPFTLVYICKTTRKFPQRKTGQFGDTRDRFCCSFRRT